MTARDLKERAGCMAAQFAERAGYSRAYWDSAVYKATNIPKKRRKALREAVMAHMLVMGELLNDLDDDEA